MAGVAIRKAFYDLLAGSAALAALGFPAGSLYPNYGPDSPPQRQFMVLRWGATTVGVGTANSTDLTLWTYDRDQDWTKIQSALMLLRSTDRGGGGLLDTLLGVRLPVGSVLGIDWTGSSTDLFDDVYEANVRSDTYRITATGN